MKKYLSSLAFIISAFSFSISARTVTINLGPNMGKDVTKLLRAQLSQLSPNDQANITLGKKGNYYLCGTVEAKCNITISGAGSKSKLILCNGTDKSDFKAFTDDSFLEFIGTKEHPIAVDIHDISIDLQAHNGLWWQNNADGSRNEKFAVKIYHANSVNVKNVNSTLKNAFCTTFNLRVCENINFSNCNLTNYNNCYGGGIIWIEGATSNVSINNNVLNKYGNDEALGIYGNQLEINKGKATYGKATKNNIYVNNNVFNYGYSGNDKANVMNDVLISFFTNGYENGTRCVLESLKFSNNKLNIHDPMRITLQFKIDETDTYSRLAVTGNRFLNSAINSAGERFYKTDIKIDDKSDYTNHSPIEISQNSFINEHPILTQWGSTGLSHIQMSGGKVHFSGNRTNDEQAAKELKGGILAYITASSTLNLSGNSSYGLEMISSISDGEGVENVSINATNNVFDGATTIYCDKVQHLDLNFERNTFRSTNMNFFLQEFAKEGSVVFNHNNVTVSGGGGQLMTHWANSSVKNMQFSTLEVIGNTFWGIDNEQTMLINMQNIGKKTIIQNSFFK